MSTRERRTRPLRVSCDLTETEYYMLRKLADEAGLSMSARLRTFIRDATRENLKLVKPEETKL